MQPDTSESGRFVLVVEQEGDLPLQDAPRVLGPRTSLVRVHSIEDAHAFIRAFELGNTLCVVLVSGAFEDNMKLLHEIRAHPRLGHTPIVLVPRNPSPQSMRLALEGGVNGYVERPQSEEEFGRAMADLLHFWVNKNLVPSPRVERV